MRQIPHVNHLFSEMEAAVTACTHFVGFRDDRYWNAVKV